MSKVHRSSINYGSNVHHSADKYSKKGRYGIANYIYFNYNNWRTSDISSFSGLGTTEATLKASIAQKIQEEDAYFEKAYGMSYEDYTKQIVKSINLITAFQDIITGAQQKLRTDAGHASFTVNRISEAREEISSSSDLLSQILSISGLGLDEQTLMNFFKTSGDLGLDIYTIHQMMQTKTAVEQLNSLMSGETSIKVNPRAAILKDALERVVKDLSSSYSFAQIGTSNFNSDIAKTIEKEFGAAATSKSSVVENSISKFSDILTKIDQNQEITKDEITSAMTELQSALGVKAEVLQALEEKFTTGYGEAAMTVVNNKLVNYTINKLANIKLTGTQGVTSNVGEKITASLDGKAVLSTSGNVTLENLLGNNKTADVTVTIGNQVINKMSGKRLNPFTPYKITITERRLVRLLAYLQVADPTLSTLVNSEVFFNALYFAYGQRSYSSNIRKSGKGKGNFVAVQGSAGELNHDRIDREHGGIISNFALRIFLDSISTMQQTSFNINGMIIPGPLFIRLVTSNLIKKYNSSTGNSSIFNSVQFNSSSFTGAFNKAIFSNQDIITSNGTHDDYIQRASLRNTLAKEIILNQPIRVNTPFISFEDYRKALGVNN